MPPVLEALSVVRGELVCSNDGRGAQRQLLLVADERGRDQRQDRHRRAPLLRARAGAAGPGRGAGARSPHVRPGPEEIGAVLVATCTSERLIPSVACWLSGAARAAADARLGRPVAACAGLPYGLAEAVRLIQEVERPVLLVCVEKFSDKIGAVRTSRMIFGDGAAAMSSSRPPTASAATSRCCRPTPAARSRGQLDHLAEPGVRQRHHGLRPRGQVAGAALPGPDARRARRAARPGRAGTAAAGIDRADRAAPGQQDDDPRPGREGRACPPTSSTSTSPDVGNVSAASIPIALADAVARRRRSTGRRGCSRRASAPARSAVTRCCGVDPAIIAPGAGHRPRSPTPAAAPRRPADDQRRRPRGVR